MRREEQESLSLLQQVGEVLAPGIGPMSEALPRIAERLASLWKADAALVLLWDPVTGELRPVVAQAPEEQLAVHAGTIREVFRTQKAVLTSDSAVDYRYAMGGKPPEAGTRSILCAPLPVGSQSIGVVHLERREADAYSLKDLRLFQAVANLLAVVIEQMQRLESRPMRSDEVGAGDRRTRLIGESPAFERTLSVSRQVAEHPTTVLLIGETGTGKELLAREVHRLSPQGKRNGPFVALNCAAIPGELFESELFGHERGSFTGANRLQRGKVELAHGGTLFLDEIGDLSPSLQPKLLRFLQEKVFYRVGGTRPLRVEVRLIAATNMDLEEAVKKGTFREDLYHRLSVIPIVVPALRQRRPDIRPLAEYFAVKFAGEMGKPIVGISDEAIITLERYQWPGNVRELENTMERAVLLCDGKVILPRHLLLPGALQRSRPENVRLEGIAEPNDDTEPFGFGFAGSRRKNDSSGGQGNADGVRSAVGGGTFGRVVRPREEDVLKLEVLERRAIKRALELCGWNQVQAAERLGIHRNTLRKKITDYQLRPTPGEVTEVRED
jgi:Nif-specific regulatory protein